MAFNATATSYDEVQYSDTPYPQSHPGHLAVVSTLAGLTPPPVGRCRVLEIGCARGGNLIPMAVGLPGGSFLGIDASAGQVAAGCAVIESLGLQNVAIERRDILDVGDELGPFDYIICHGTYSWVPAEVRDRILEILARALAPHGVAYLSYNTLPGWRARGLVRDLMVYHAGRFERPDDRAREARRALEFMAASAPLFDRTYAAMLGEECRYLRDRPDSYLLHDHLEAFNEPVYFHEMVRRASAKGLRFVSEVQSSLLDVESLYPAVAAGWKALSTDEVALEQHLDFLINRTFRQSVFCHARREPGRSPRPQDLAALDVAAPDAGTLPRVAFRNERLLLAALACVGEARPGAVPWTSLIGAARARIGSDPGGVDESRDAEDLTADLLRCYRLKAIELRPRDWTFAARAAERPMASPLARHQAGHCDIVTNLKHQAVQLNHFSRLVLSQLDGNRDRNEILSYLRAALRKGLLVPSAHGVVSSRDAAQGPSGPTEGELDATLERCLEKLARFALLMG